MIFDVFIELLNCNFISFYNKKNPIKTKIIEYRENAYKMSYTSKEVYGVTV